MKCVTLYTKPGCHLCEAVEQVIVSVQKRIAFNLETRDIMQDPADFQRYGELIPVVTIDGIEIARYRLAEATLVAALQHS